MTTLPKDLKRLKLIAAPGGAPVFTVTGYQGRRRVSLVLDGERVEEFGAPLWADDAAIYYGEWAHRMAYVISRQSRETGARRPLYTLEMDQAEDTWLPMGSALGAISDSGHLRVWDVRSGARLCDEDLSVLPIWSMLPEEVEIIAEVAPDRSAAVIAVSEGGRSRYDDEVHLAILWSRAEGMRVVNAREPFTCAVVAPGGELLAVWLAPGDERAEAGCDQRVRVFNAYDELVGRVPVLPEHPVTHVSFAPDTRHLMVELYDGTFAWYDTTAACLSGVLYARETFYDSSTMLGTAWCGASDSVGWFGASRWRRSVAAKSLRDAQGGWLWWSSAKTLHLWSPSRELEWQAELEVVPALVAVSGDHVLVLDARNTAQLLTLTPTAAPLEPTERAQSFIRWFSGRFGHLALEPARVEAAASLASWCRVQSLSASQRSALLTHTRLLASGPYNEEIADALDLFARDGVGFTTTCAQLRKLLDDAQLTTDDEELLCWDILAAFTRKDWAAQQDAIIATCSAHPLVSATDDAT